MKTHNCSGKIGFRFSYEQRCCGEGRSVSLLPSILVRDDGRGTITLPQILTPFSVQGYGAGSVARAMNSLIKRLLGCFCRAVRQQSCSTLKGVNRHTRIIVRIRRDRMRKSSRGNIMRESTSMG